MRAAPLAALFCLLSSAAFAQDASPLPAGAGRDVVIRVCSKCHAPDVVMTQSLDVDGWKDILDQMKSNGAVFTDDEATQIVGYLSKQFGK